MKRWSLLLVLDLVLGACGPTPPASTTPSNQTPPPSTTATDPGLTVASELTRYVYPVDPELVAKVDAALAEHPTSPSLRYARACFAMVNGDEARARELLGGLVAEGDATVRNVQTDEECGWTPALQALGVSVPPTGPRAALEAIAADATTAPYFGGEVQYTSECSLCDPADGETTSTAMVTGAELQAQVAGWQTGEYQSLSIPFRAYCDDECCTLPVGSLAHNTIFLTDLCIDTVTEQVRAIAVIDGG